MYFVRANREHEGVTMSYLCPQCNSFPMEDYVWWVSGREGGGRGVGRGGEGRRGEGVRRGREKSIQIGGARSVEKNTAGSNQTGSWWCKQAKVSTKPRSSERVQCLRAYAGI